MPLQAVLGREGKECKECVQFPEHNPNKYEGKEGLRTPLFKLEIDRQKGDNTHMLHGFTNSHKVGVDIQTP